MIQTLLVLTALIVGAYLGHLISDRRRPSAFDSETAMRLRRTVRQRGVVGWYVDTTHPSTWRLGASERNDR